MVSAAAQATDSEARKHIANDHKCDELGLVGVHPYGDQKQCGL